MKIRNKQTGQIIDIDPSEAMDYGLEVPSYMQMGGGLTDWMMGYGGYMAEGGINNPGFRALPEYVQEKIMDNMASGGCMQCGGKMQEGGTKKRSKKLTKFDPSMLQILPYRPGIDTATMQTLPYRPTPGRTPMDNLILYAEGGKLPKEILRARLESHMSPGEAEDYLSSYGMGGYLDEAGDGKWIQKVTKSIKKRGTEGVCTGSKFGGPSCPPGSKRYNLAKTFRKMAKSRNKEDGGTMYEVGDEIDITPAQKAQMERMGYTFE